MRKRTIFRIICIFLILLCLSVAVVHAADNWSDVNQFDNYTSAGTGWEVVDNVVARTLGVFLDIIRIIAACLGVLMLIIIGIKYMIVKDPGHTAELKKQMPFYFTGVVILFGASGILKLVTYFIKDAFGS